MSTLFQDLKFGLRMLAKNPGFTVVAMLTLALGIGANAVIFSVINGLFLHPAGIADPAHVFAIRVKYQKLNLPSIVISAPDFADVRDSRQIFSSTAASDEEGFNYLAADGPERLMAAKVTWEWFNVFGVRPLVGRVFQPEEDQPQRQSGGGARLRHLAAPVRRRSLDRRQEHPVESPGLPCGGCHGAGLRLAPPG